MISESITFECITPCFCAGADQTKAEIRPSAIRGALRWWFRALGGTREQENEVFGGSEPVAASALRIRVRDVRPKPVGHLHQPRGEDPLSYILYFPSVSSDKRRWNPESCFGAGTTFVLEIHQMRALPDATLFRDALQAFRHYGSIGMHVTRGLGAVHATGITPETIEQTDQMLTKAGFTIRKSPHTHNIWDQALKEVGQRLQGDFREEYGAGGNKKPPQASALGSTPISDSKLKQNNWKQVPRQTSAVYLRPFKRSDGKLMVVAFEAPHERVLGAVSRSRHSEPILASRDFSRPLPPPRQGDRRGNRPR